jgi:hypothetical protein
MVIERSELIMDTKDDALSEGKLMLIATKNLKANDELYKIVDFLNKTLKEHQIMFGLTKNNKNDTMTISVYEV